MEFINHTICYFYFISFEFDMQSFEKDIKLN